MFHTGLARSRPLFAITQRLTDDSRNIPLWHRCVPKGAGFASPRGGCALFTLSCRLLSLGIAAAIWLLSGSVRLALYAPPVEWVVLQEWSFPRIAAQILSLLVDLITTSAGASRDIDLQSDLVLPHCGVAAGHQYSGRKVRLKPPRRLSMNTACAAVLFF